MQRRIIGMDLGVTSAHTACVMDAEGRVLLRRKVHPTAGDLASLRAAALAGADKGCVLEVVVDPTGPVWLPVAVFFIERGDTVFRVSSSEASNLRKVLSRGAKTNRIDAESLGKLAILRRGELHALRLPRGDRAALDRRVRVTERLTEEIADRKRRIRDLARTLMPTVGPAISKTISRSDLEVLRNYGDPRELRKLGLEALTALIEAVSRGEHGERKARLYLAAAEEACALYGDSDAVAFAELASELETEIRLLEILEATLAPHAKAREAAYQAVDGEQELARSLPGIGLITAAVATAFLGDTSRFRNGDQFVSFTGLVPRTSETGDTDRKGGHMTKAGNRKLRRAFHRAADTARKEDPQLARVYFEQMVNKGANHTKALSVVAAHLARRFWRVMERGTPYVLRDVDATEVPRQEAKRIIAERYTVPEHVRARRRPAKAKRRGKAPHHGHESRVNDRARGAISTRRPSPATIVGSRKEMVKSKS